MNGPKARRGGWLSKRDLPLWIEQFPPQVIRVELMSHGVSVLADSELEMVVVARV